MANPQQPELRRSERNEALSPDAMQGRLEASRHVEPDERGPGPVPESNRSGHHDDEDQDKPDLDAFAEKLGIVDPEARPGDPEEGAEEAEALMGGGSRAEPAADGPFGSSDAAELLSDEAQPLPEVASIEVGRGGPAEPGLALAALCTRVVFAPWILVGRLAERAQSRMIVVIEHRGRSRP
jgi:hypothetical protein